MFLKDSAPCPRGSARARVAKTPRSTHPWQRLPRVLPRHLPRPCSPGSRPCSPAWSPGVPRGSAPAPAAWTGPEHGTSLCHQRPYGSDKRPPPQRPWGSQGDDPLFPTLTPLTLSSRCAVAFTVFPVMKLFIVTL